MLRPGLEEPAGVDVTVGAGLEHAAIPITNGRTRAAGPAKRRPP